MRFVLIKKWLLKIACGSEDRLSSSGDLFKSQISNKEIYNVNWNTFLYTHPFLWSPGPKSIFGSSITRGWLGSRYFTIQTISLKLCTFNYNGKNLWRSSVYLTNDFSLTPFLSNLDRWWSKGLSVCHEKVRRFESKMENNNSMSPGSLPRLI